MSDSHESKYKTLAEMSNDEFVYQLMLFSKFGGLSGVFVIEAIRAYSESVVEKGRPPYDGNALISPDMWFDIAVDTQRRVKEKYEPEVKEESRILVRDSKLITP